MWTVWVLLLKESIPLIISPLSSININTLNMFWHSLSSQESQNAALSLNLSLTDFLIRLALSEFEPLWMTYLSKLFCLLGSNREVDISRYPFTQPVLERAAWGDGNLILKMPFFVLTAIKGLPTSGTDVCNEAGV